MRSVFFLLSFVFILGSCKLAKAPVTKSSSLQFQEFCGMWRSNDTSVQLVFLHDNEQKLQLVMWDELDGKQVITEKLETKNDLVITTERAVSTGWVTHNTYGMESDGRLKCVCKNDNGEFTLFFTRVKLL